MCQIVSVENIEAALDAQAAVAAKARRRPHERRHVFARQRIVGGYLGYVLDFKTMLDREDFRAIEIRACEHAKLEGNGNELAARLCVSDRSGNSRDQRRTSEKKDRRGAAAHVSP